MVLYSTIFFFQNEEADGHPLVNESDLGCIDKDVLIVIDQGALPQDSKLSPTVAGEESN